MNLINQKGNLINQDGNLINHEGNLINQDGCLINKEGKLITQETNLINQERHLINQEKYLINERDISKSLKLKNLRNIEPCNYSKYIKSNYVKNTYPQLLLASENNLFYIKNLIKTTDNIYSKYHYKKTLVQHAELIKIFITKLEELLGYLCKNNKEEEINNIKTDILALHFFEYQTYKTALNILSEIKIFFKNIQRYNILDQIDILNYKTNLSGIEYVKAKFEYNNMPNEAKKINEIINNYKISHDDNILDEIKELEKTLTIEGFENVELNSTKKLLIICLFIIVLLYII